MSERFVLVMAGGSGTRLWPASTPERPKHLLGLAPDAPSLLAATLERAATWAPPERTYVITTADQRAALLAALPRLSPAQLLVEPRGRNTAACVAHGLVAIDARLRAAGEGDEARARAVVLALPADHHVRDRPAFERAILAAADEAARDRVIVTLGITPTHADTGYGYIERDDRPISDNIFPVRRFVEKPDAARAAEFLATGRFLWNAGVFALPVAPALAALAAHAPAIAAAFAPYAAALAAGDPDAAAAALSRAYDEVPRLPIDIALMEKLDDLRVVPVQAGWDDLGSWAAVHAVAPHDAAGNALLTGARPVHALDAEGTLVWSDDAEVAVIGVRGLAVIASGGKVLVCPLDRAQEVRAIAERSAAARRPPT